MRQRKQRLVESRGGRFFSYDFDERSGSAEVIAWIMLRDGTAVFDVEREKDNLMDAVKKVVRMAKKYGFRVTGGPTEPGVTLKRGGGREFGIETDFAILNDTEKRWRPDEYDLEGDLHDLLVDILGKDYGFDYR